MVCVENTWSFHGAWRWDRWSAGMPKCMSKYSKGFFLIQIDDIYFFIIVSKMFTFFQSRRFWLTNLNPVTCIKAAHYPCIVSNQHTHTQTHSCTSVATLLYHLIYILFKFNFYNLRMVICVTRSPPHSFARYAVYIPKMLGILNQKSNVACFDGDCGALCVPFSAMKNVVIVGFSFKISKRINWSEHLKAQKQRTIAGNEKLEQQENNDKQQTKEEKWGRISSEKTMKRKKNKYRMLE